MPASTKKRPTFVNRKKELLKQTGFQGFQNATFTTKRNASITNQKFGGVALFTRAERNNRKKLATLLKSVKPKAKAPFTKRQPKPNIEKVFGAKKSKRVIEDKVSMFLPQLYKQTTRKSKAATQEVRSSIKPGSVVILLAGRFAGKRVVVLKVFPSGHILVTGPFKINGVPLRRTLPSYVIATSTSVDISNIAAVATLQESTFKVQKKKSKAPVSDADVFKKDDKTAAKKDKKAVEQSDEVKKLQVEIDEALIANINKQEYLADYIKSSFTLKNNDFPHLMKF